MRGGGGRVLDEEGREVEGGGRGYRFVDYFLLHFSHPKEILNNLIYICGRYFGRARELPGVKELFEPKKRPSESASALATRSDLRKQVDASYYGYNLDEEDGTLLAYEKERGEEMRQELLKKGDGMVAEGWEPLPGDAGDGIGWRLPTLEEVGEELLERRKRKALEDVGEELIERRRELLNRLG